MASQLSPLAIKPSMHSKFRVSRLPNRFAVTRIVEVNELNMRTLFLDRVDSIFVRESRIQHFDRFQKC